MDNWSTEETGIHRRKRSPYTQEEIEKGLQLLLSSTIARTETWLHIHFLLPFRRDDGLPTPSENYHCYRKGCSTTLMYINQWKALFVVTGADSLNTRSWPRPSSRWATGSPPPSSRTSWPSTTPRRGCSPSTTSSWSASTWSGWRTASNLGTARCAARPSCSTKTSSAWRWGRTSRQSTILSCTQQQFTHAMPRFTFFGDQTKYDSTFQCDL